MQESLVEMLWRLLYYVKFYSPKCSDLVAVLTLLGEWSLKIQKKENVLLIQ
jgi:hypothetical protein